MSLNIVALNGRLCGEPELRHTQSDVAVCSFTLAVDGFKKDQTNFIDIVCWNKTAEFASKYFTKGQLVAVEGTLQTRSYEDKQGNKRKAVEVVASQVHFAERKQGGTYDELANNAKAQGQHVGAVEDEFVEITGDDSDLPF